MQEQLAPDGTQDADDSEAEPLLVTRRCQDLQRTGGDDCPVPWRTLAALWAMAFCLNCKPSEPYLSKYIMEDKGVSEDDLNHRVYPFSIYGSLLFLGPVGILAEHFGYRAVIMGGLVCRELTRVLLIFAAGVPWMAAMQLTYAGSVAANSIFFAYAYVVVPPQHYALATGGVHAAYHGGNFVGSMLGELLVSHTAVSKDLQILFYISWVTTTAALLLFWLYVPKPSLPQPPSLYSIVKQPNGQAKAAAAVRALYSSSRVRLASLWWVFGSASTSLCSNVFQTYFYTLDSTAPFGAIEGGLELLMAASAAAVALPAMAVAVTTRSTELLGGTAALSAALMALGTVAGQELAAANSSEAGGGNGGSLVWVVVPIISAMGITGGQEAAASAAIAAALSLGAHGAGKRSERGKSDPSECMAPAMTTPTDDEQPGGREEEQHRFAVIFPLNTFASLLVASALQLSCAEAECSTTEYLWMAVVGNFLTVAALVVALVTSA